MENAIPQLALQTLDDFAIAVENIEAYVKLTEHLGATGGDGAHRISDDGRFSVDRVGERVFESIADANAYMRWCLEAWRETIRHRRELVRIRSEASADSLAELAVEWQRYEETLAEITARRPG